MHKVDPAGVIVSLVNEIRARQELDGSIQEPGAADYAKVNGLIAELDRQAGQIDGLSTDLLAATLGDLGRWVQDGLHQRPLFDKTLANFKTPLPGEAFFFMAPMRATNGPDPEGFRLELVTGYRSETPYLADAGQYTEHYVAPFQCIKLGAASRGFSEGNCIVLFPESVAAENKVDKQAFALFFFSKFSRIYNEQTLLEADRLFGPDSEFLFGQLSSRQMSEADIYDARCLWGYYHDYAHHTGPRPLDKNLYIKLNWFTGLLEETKCDLITVRLLQKHRPDFWQEVVEFILLERMFRYPKGSERHMTFDAGTGILLFEILVNAKALIEDEQGRLKFDSVRLGEQISAVISDIEALESLDDEAYLAGARQYVHKHLGMPETPQARFNFPASQYARRVLEESSR
ncbi:DUF6421 family protein [Pseudomonas lijiangensis]|uniref:DUF6421 family protein n=1 Tax=Pseudomonas lijiangensis TaxID=2995658 RepID=UPI001C87CB81|nr:DUF6421 family protein [Pseudomonas cichorii]MBX8489638.1 hypothetical protein [Pseudomonas cichorii]MBX8602955.1 hypothetical protein [Pseudomonas cichorii]